MKPIVHLPPSRSPREAVHELVQGCAFEEAGDISSAAFKAAYYLFSDLIGRVGIDAARQAFLNFGEPPTPEQLKKWRHESLLRRHDLMPKPNVQQLARLIAKENESLPRDRQHGPGGTDWANLDKLLRRLLKARDRARAKKLDKPQPQMSRTKGKSK